MTDVTKPTKTEVDYEDWLIRELIHHNPNVCRDFRDLQLSTDLIPEEFRHLTTLSNRVILPLYRTLVYSGDYDKALIELAQRKGDLQFYNPKDDGVTHINVYSKGSTKLGRALTNFAPIGFTHPKYGQFQSVEGFWYWLSTGKQADNLRNLSGFEAKSYGKSLGVKVQVDNFEEQIKEALFYKVEQNPKLAYLLKESTLPFSHYYYYGSLDNCKVIANDSARWFVDYLELLRQYTKGLAQKVIIAGSRTVQDKEVVFNALKQSKLNPVLFVSGAANGVDKIGEDIASDLKLPVRQFFPDWDTLGKRAGMVRNVEMGDYADALVAVWDDKSKGTKQMISYMKSRKPTFVTIVPLPKEDVVTYTSNEHDPAVLKEKAELFKKLSFMRRFWIKAARIYYLLPGDDTGMEDHHWDHYGRLLYKDRHLFPECPILHDPAYEGGSLYWVKRDMYDESLKLYTPPIDT